MKAKKGKKSTGTQKQQAADVKTMNSSVHDPLLSAEIGMGKVRRRFLIVSVFDLCLITLLWVICTVSKGSDWPTVFLREVNIFQWNFSRISLFDIVITAIARSFVLVLFYAFLLISHWIPVAITTVATTLFLVFKALFFFSPVQGNLPQFILFVSSFVVAWFELWLVPFRVLPSERRRIVTPEDVRPRVVAMRNTQTDEEFRSAMEYSSDSETEDDYAKSMDFNARVFSKAEYVNAVDRARVVIKDLLTQVDTWKTLRGCNPLIRYCEDKRIYYVRDEVACSPQSLFRASWKDNKLWNKQIVDTQLILQISATTELVHTITVPSMHGYVASRDLLDVRKIHSDTENDIYEGFYVSVDSSIVPANKNKRIVRATNGPSCVRITPCNNGDKSTAYFEWIQDIDIKGGIPKRLIEHTMCTFFCNYMGWMKAHIKNNSAEYP